MSRILLRIGMRGVWLQLVSWLTLGAFFLAHTPGLAAPASQRAAKLGCACCGCADLHEGADHESDETPQVSEAPSDPAPPTPPLPGGCCFCNSAKVPCPVAAAPSVVGSAVAESELPVAQPQYAAPFRGVATPPPKA